MQHLNEDYGIEGPAIPYVVRGNVSPPSTFQEFIDFPGMLGWRVEPLSHILRVDGEAGKATEPYGSFLQAWLFFGLIYTVVQENGKPTLAMNKLLSEKSPDYITTGNLPCQLSRWTKTCIQAGRDDPHGSRLRMIRIENVLDIARRVVRANLVDRIRADVGDPLYISDEVVLSIMVLGETLCSAKNRVIENGTRMHGWHDEDERGWGPPIWVLDEMTRDLWCPRAIHLLRTQLRSNATLLVAAFQVKNKSPSTAGARHHDEDPAKKCTARVCYVTPEETPGHYNQCHCDNFCKNRELEVKRKELCGPEDKVVRDMLKDNQRPLLQFYDAEGDNLDLKVIRHTPDLKYVTISHVWSDGFGNPDFNKLRPCQMKFIRHHLSRFQSGASGTLPFWMDTLLIPVGTDPDSERLRKLAIKQITDVFRDSVHTIVVDFGLSGLHTDESPAQTAIKILASNWMRRLWTLQEAYLSRSIYVAFKHERAGLRDLEKLFRDLTEKEGELTTNLVNMVHNQLQHNLMNSERQARHQHPNTRVERQAQVPRKASVLVANAWKAARWRTTSSEFHETLALATLLELDFDTESEIANAGLEKNTRWRDKSDEEKAKHRDKLMKLFWMIFNKKYLNSIPPGMIFLPPPRLEVVGYGWAPRTWMSAHELDFPDPLSFTGLDFTSHLEQNGLRVCFPGFLLHTGNRRKVLLTDQDAKSFQFPVDPKLKEWYVVERADDVGEQTWFLESVLNGTNQLAIVLSRPRPRDSQAEIGLLVQISHHQKEDFELHQLRREQSDQAQEWNQENGRDHQTVIEREEREAFVCKIIRRVKVSRSTAASPGFTDQKDHLRVQLPGDLLEPPQTTTQREFMAASESDADICIGEILESNQIWFVDGFPPMPASSEHDSRLKDKPDVNKNRLMLFMNKHMRSNVDGLANPTAEYGGTSHGGPTSQAGVRRIETIDVSREGLPTSSNDSPGTGVLRRNTTFKMLSLKFRDSFQNGFRRPFKRGR